MGEAAVAVYCNTPWQNAPFCGSVHNAGCMLGIGDGLPCAMVLHSLNVSLLLLGMVHVLLQWCLALHVLCLSSVSLLLRDYDNT